ncbi:MAG: hypothetical protein H7Z16_02055 [Pyrinomonadaceae bacterium]|nr:hypothetical protein [Pyrinomonadaceae bacterium]
MRRSRWLLVFTLVVIALVASWLWWVKPKPVDMSVHAPAHSLVYLEANSPLGVVEALEHTDAWKIVESLSGTRQNAPGNPWVRQFVAWTGLGPVESVIMTRAQVAVVVTDLGATEDADTLRIKPEGALIIETKTSERRIRPAVEEAIKKLAELTYGKAISRNTTIDGVNFIEWVAPEGSRQIVAIISGSLVIVGNTRQAVQDCLAVSQGRKPSLREDAELNRLRSQLGATHALSFGYVPAANSARLLSIGVPLLLGRAPANSEFQRLIAGGASKVVGSLAWSSRSFKTGIEDRFLFSLQPSIVARLRPAFTSVKLSSQLQKILPNDVHSITYYKFENPGNAWKGLKSAVSSQVDALLAVVFSSLLNSSLGSYGIDDPERFLAAVTSEIVTLRVNQNSERSLLVARVRDRASLRELFAQTMQARAPRDKNNVEILDDSQGELSAGFIGDFIVMGSPTDVRLYTEELKNNSVLSDPGKLQRLTFFVPFSSSASIVTYADDSDRARRFFSAVLAVNGVAPGAATRMDQMLNDLPYSATETTLGQHGLERTTLSPLGQFSTLLPLLIPAERAPASP